MNHIKAFSWGKLLLWCLLVLGIKAVCFDLFYTNGAFSYLASVIFFAIQLFLVWREQENRAYVCICGFLYSSLFCIDLWCLESFLLRDSQNYAPILDKWQITLEAAGFLACTSIIAYQTYAERKTVAEQGKACAGKGRQITGLYCFAVWLELMLVTHALLFVSENTNVKGCFIMLGLTLTALLPLWICKQFQTWCHRYAARIYAAAIILLGGTALWSCVRNSKAVPVVLWCVCLDILGMLFSTVSIPAQSEETPSRFRPKLMILLVISVLSAVVLWADLFMDLFKGPVDPFVLMGAWLVLAALVVILIKNRKMYHERLGVCLCLLLLLITVYYPVYVMTRGFPAYARDQLIREYNLKDVHTVMTGYYVGNSSLEDEDGSVDLRELEKAVSHQYTEITEAVGITKDGGERKLLFIYEYKSLDPLKTVHILLLEDGYQLGSVTADETFWDHEGVCYPIQAILR